MKKKRNKNKSAKLKTTHILQDSLNELINCIPGCLYWKDHHGIYLGCNALTAKLAGLKSVQEIAGKTDDELWGQQADWLISNDRQVITSGKIIKVEETLQTADGKWLYFTGVKMPLRDKRNRIIGIIGNSLDITELKNTQAQLKKAKEEAEALSKAKSNFIANMSHDVKTPLSGIIGLSKVLLDKLTGEEFDLVQSIALSGQQLMNFFENCIEVSKSESAKLVLEKEPFDLKILIDQIIELFQPAAQNKGLAFYLYYDNKIPSCLLGNRIAIYRVVLNLMGNAIKFTHRGSVVLHVNLSKKSTQKKAMIELIVEDTGIGIPKNKQKIIFEHFTRLVPSYKGIYEGSGIGLHLANKFVKAMKGEIQVESKEGKGSRFIVTLPLIISRNSPVPAVPIELQPSPMITRMLSRILLIEDNPIAQKIAQQMLTIFSHRVEIAETGEKALQLFAPGKYDLVLIDIGLPDISGYKISRHIRNMEKTTKHHVPIIALTAHANKNIKKSCLKAGIEHVFSKPLSKEMMQLIINHFILGGGK